MRFSVGYQLADSDEESFAAIVQAYRESIAEVYFSWIGHPSGRSPIGLRADDGPESAQRRLETDLTAFRAMGVRLNLLFNANCYAGDGMSRRLEDEVRRVIERVIAVAGTLEAVTTTSPAVAYIVGKHFPGIERRASVNMRIGTVEGMAYVAHLFDAYCVQRDVNRDLHRLRELKAWADENGKILSLLVNSGCLRHCSGQTFHDNLVAHEMEVSESENMPDFMPYTCWNFLRDRRNWPVLLQGTWIRPEDLHHYDELFGIVKLATRLHERPHVVIRAYAARQFAGNLLDLLEPGFSRAIAPCVIDNARFPSDWFERTGKCDRRCHRCDYCAATLEHVLVDLSR